MPLPITTDQMDAAWDDADAQRADMDVRQSYYDGDHDITSREEFYADGTPKTNRVANWVRYVVNRYAGLIASQPYQIADDEGEDNAGQGADTYAIISDDNDLTKVDVDILRTALIQGMAVEVHEFVDGQILVSASDPRNWAFVYNSDGGLVGAIRRTKLSAGTVHDGQVLSKELELMAFYDDTTIRDFQRTGDRKAWVEVKETAHEFGQIPLVLWELNPDGESIITDALIGQNDEYNEISSAAGDDIRREVDSLLKTKGIDPKWMIDHAAEIRELRVLPLGNDAHADADYIMRRADVEPATRHLARTRDAIHMIGEVPDIEQITGATGVTSGIALKLKFMPMVQNALAMTNHIKCAIRDRIELFNDRLSKTGGPAIDAVNITIPITLPVNRIEEWQNIAALDGVVSHTTQLELLSDIDDPAFEVQRMAAEADEAPVTPETAQAMNDATVLNLAEQTTPVIQTILDGIETAITDTLLRNGVIDRRIAVADKATVEGA